MCKQDKLPVSVYISLSIEQITILILTILPSLFAIFILAWLIQIAFLNLVFSKLRNYLKSDQFKGNQKEKTQNKTNPLPISIIVCAHNELENLRRLVPIILAQNYPQFQLLIVDDRSTDGTSDFLQPIQNLDDRLVTITIKEENKDLKGKKNALSQGIEAAKFEHLLLTDADCIPASGEWIKYMTKDFSEGASMILGVSPYLSDSGLLNKLIQFETTYTCIHYLSFALIGSPYMGVGRNLAYRKSLYYKANGFSKHGHIPSGDDDLFVSQIAPKEDVRINFEKKSLVFSNPPSTWKKWYYQKRRHLTTGKHYPLKAKVLLTLLSGSHLLLYGMFFALAVYGFKIKILILLLFIRWISQLFIFKPVLERVGRKKLFLHIPYLDLLLFFYYVIFSQSLILDPTNTWKHHHRSSSMA